MSAEQGPIPVENTEEHQQTYTRCPQGKNTTNDRLRLDSPKESRPHDNPRLGIYLRQQGGEAHLPLGFKANETRRELSIDGNVLVKEHLPTRIRGKQVRPIRWSGVPQNLGK